MNKEHFWNDIERKRELLRARPDPVSICPSHMLHKLAWDEAQSAMVTGWHLTETQHKNHIKKCLSTFYSLKVTTIYFMWT